MTEAKLTTTEPSTRKWTDRLLFLFGFASLVVGVAWFSVFTTGRGVEMGIAATASLLLMLFARLDQFKSVKAGGLEFHTQEARAVVAEAQLTVEQVRQLAVQLGRTSLDTMARASVLGVYPDPLKLSAMQELRASMRTIGVPEQQLEEVCRGMMRMLKLRHIAKIRTAADIILGDDSEEERRDRVRTQLTDFTGLQKREPASPSEVRRFLLEEGVSGEKLEELLRDYEYFVENERHRRPDIWELPR